MVKHTPGPWQQGSAWYLVDGKGGNGVASVDVGTPYAEANARLITAAPAMLAALERVHDGLSLLEPEYRSGPLACIQTMRAATKEAIAQARSK